MRFGTAWDKMRITNSGGPFCHLVIILAISTTTTQCDATMHCMYTNFQLDLIYWSQFQSGWSLGTKRWLVGWGSYFICSRLAGVSLCMNKLWERLSHDLLTLYLLLSRSVTVSSLLSLLFCCTEKRREERCKKRANNQTLLFFSWNAFTNATTMG